SWNGRWAGAAVDEDHRHEGRAWDRDRAGGGRRGGHPAAGGRADPAGHRRRRGIAGLVAARALQLAGVDVVVVEGRDRIGGGGAPTKTGGGGGGRGGGGGARR